jgi:hypothetical protein
MEDGRSGLAFAAFSLGSGFIRTTTNAPATAAARPERASTALVTLGCDIGRTGNIAFRANGAGRRCQKGRKIRLFAGADHFRLRTARLGLEAIIVPETIPAPVAVPITIMATAASAIIAAAMLLEAAFALRLRLGLAFATLDFPALAFRLTTGAIEAAAIRVRLLHGLRRAEGEAIGRGIEIIVIIIAFISRTAEGGLLGLHGGCDETVIMLGVLEIAFSRNRIAREMGIARELGVFLGDVLRGAAHFHIGTVRFIGTRQRIGPATVAAPHALVLTWSHPVVSRLISGKSGPVGHARVSGAKELSGSPALHSSETGWMRQRRVFRVLIPAIRLHAGTEGRAAPSSRLLSFPRNEPAVFAQPVCFLSLHPRWLQAAQQFFHRAVRWRSMPE